MRQIGYFIQQFYTICDSQHEKQCGDHIQITSFKHVSKKSGPEHNFRLSKRQKCCQSIQGMDERGMQNLIIYITTLR